VHYPLAVHVPHRTRDLAEDAAGEGLGQAAAPLPPQQLLDGAAGGKLRHQEQVLLILQHVQQPDHSGVLQTLQVEELMRDALRSGHVADAGFRDRLDRNHLTAGFVLAEIYRSERARAKAFAHQVLAHTPGVSTVTRL
jgi:hypothetical protein